MRLAAKLLRLLYRVPKIVGLLYRQVDSCVKDSETDVKSSPGKVIETVVRDANPP